MQSQTYCLLSVNLNNKVKLGEIPADAFLQKLRLNECIQKNI